MVLAACTLVGCSRAPSDATTAGPEQAATELTQRPSGMDGEPGPNRGLDGPEAVQHQRETTAVDAKVTSVRLSDQGDTEANTLIGSASRFGPKDTVYAEVETNGTANGYNIYAKWMAPDGSVLSDYGMRVNEPGMKRTVISMSKPDGWEKGTHSIEIAINGETQQTITFSVQ